VEAIDVHAKHAVELAQQLDDVALLAEARALREFGTLFAGRGFDEGAVEEALLHESPDRRLPLQLRPSMNAAQIYEYTFQLDRAPHLFEALRDRIVEHGEESDLPYVLVHIAICDLLSGKLEVAERYADDAIDAARLVEGELMHGFALIVRALARARRGLI